MRGMKWGWMIAGGLLTTMAGPVAGQVIHPQWSGDGTRIAFYERIDNRALLHVVNADGSGHEIVVDDNGYHANPSWSADGTALVTGSSPTGMRGTWDLFRYDLSTEQWTPLTQTAAREMHASVSPDGSRVAFVRMEDGGSDIWVLESDGTETQVTATAAQEFHPKWSPDGRRLVFDATVDRVARVHVYDFSTKTSTVLDGTNGRAVTPAFLGSDTIVFADLDGEKMSLFKSRIGSGTTERLTDLNGTAGGPFASPDGTKIAFHSDYSGAYAIHVLDLDTGEITQVSPGT